jgi:hypothetical protein
MPLELTYEPVALPDGSIAIKPGSLRPLTKEELDAIFPPKPEAP